ncbi:hypothetical protein M0L20_23025 [Spirosoma sp. RP8]|uniref:Uncharacterized protein n=1 Tax=Spirosoma liriopis TaxID=2937440 RepID=A0ABT0HRE9_9BACT|nr:hypothetical protein [Spirosoma liriopis]MCK8494760.1 hypothetical protein [Spirosoma liriopis]
MKNYSLTLSVILASLLMIVGFGWIVFDYFQDMKAGRYKQEPLVWVIELGVMLGYCYLVYRLFQHRFIQVKQAKIQPAVNTRK